MNKILTCIFNFQLVAKVILIAHLTKHAFKEIVKILATLKLVELMQNVLLKIIGQCVNACRITRVIHTESVSLMNVCPTPIVLIICLVKSSSAKIPAIVLEMQNVVPETTGAIVLARVATQVILTRRVASRVRADLTVL